MSAPKLAIAPRMLRQSWLVALVVGTLLCLINQGDTMLAGQMPDPVKLVPTYVVPFLVSTFAASNMARHTADFGSGQR